MTKLLIVDDEPDIRQNLTECFELENYKVFTAHDGLSALDILESNAIDAVMIDIFMPEKDGLETIIELRQRWPELKIVAMSGGPARLTGLGLGDDLLHAATELGADISLQKPFSLADAVATVKKLIAT